jgi:restriction system protein
MKIGDTVITPLKRQAGIMVGTITGEYKYEGAKNAPYFHSRAIEWRREPIPRSNFNQDLLYAFGAFMTICRIQRNNAETRIAKMQQLNWAAESAHTAAVTTATDQDEQVSTDLQVLADDQVARFIQARFSGHAMERLVEGILRAQGYTTSRSPVGPDGGSDIVAGFGALGFGEPRLVVEVKTGAAVGREAVDKLLGAVKKFNATEGLFISWNGFKSNVRAELAQSFFDVRLWDRTDLLSALFSNYDRLSAELRAELPLKPVWTIASEDAEDE